MKTRIRFVLIAVALLPFAPSAALAGICFNVTGLPWPAAFDFVPGEPSSQGQLPIVGEAHGVCGTGTPAAAIEGTVLGDPGGDAHVGFRFLASGPGCSGGEAEIVIPPPYESGTGQVRLPEGSVANVVLTHDPTGSSCLAVASALDPNTCVPNQTTACLQQDRFRVRTTAVFAGRLRAGNVLPGNFETAKFFFFNSSNAEAIIKVLNACSVNNRYWVFASGLTDVRTIITVTDTQRNAVRTYFNPLRNPAAPIQDTSAFATCP